MQINYFDLGTYIDALEIQLILKDVFPHFKYIPFNIYGIEAHPAYASTVREKFSRVEFVKIFNLAISNKQGTERLYLAGNALGHSIFPTKVNVNSDSFIDVPCNTFSGWIKENNISIENAVNILKLNIEGAELHVYNDLKNSGIRKYFDIICGHVSHDIMKITELKDRVNTYFNLMKELNIDLLRFCGERPEKNIDMVGEINKAIARK